VRFPIHTLDDAPQASQPLLDGIAADLGITPNLAGVAAASPALLAGFDGMRRAVATTAIDPVLREIAGLAVGVVVHNHYGIAFHSTMLANLGVTESDINAMRAGQSPSDATRATVHAFATQAAERRGAVDPSTIDALAANGLSTEAALELILEVGFASLVGLIDNLAGHVELDAFLAPRAVGSSGG
jgi:alkylhydroperoxidase family enzyme